MDLSAAAAQEERGLTGGVAAADDGDRAGAACLRLDLSGRVIHPDALQLSEPVHGQPVVASAGGNDHRLGRDDLAVIESDPMQAIARRQCYCPGRQLDTDAELLRL